MIRALLTQLRTRDALELRVDRRHEGIHLGVFGGGGCGHRASVAVTLRGTQAEKVLKQRSGRTQQSARPIRNLQNVAIINELCTAVSLLEKVPPLKRSFICV